jgi:hypothetical protein
MIRERCQRHLRGVDGGGGGGACGSDARERERGGRKKGRDWVLYPLMFVGPTHQPMNISGLAYVVAMAPYVCQPPDEHKLHTSVFKPMNVIQNMNVGPTNIKNPTNECLFPVVGL